MNVAIYKLVHLKRVEKPYHNLLHENPCLTERKKEEEEEEDCNKKLMRVPKAIPRRSSQSYIEKKKHGFTSIPKKKKQRDNS